jgi:protoporphyrinogen oxidase
MDLSYRWDRSMTGRPRATIHTLVSPATPRQTAVIIGAGPAGLTAAYEFLKRTGIHPIVLEKSEYMGGLARTVNYKGNRIDMGGHRFFSKSDRVMEWWLRVLPLEASSSDATDGAAAIRYQGRERTVATSPAGPDPRDTDLVMLLRPRKSRIYYLRRFFDYPITLSASTVANLGVWRTFKIGMSYLKSVLFPLKNERTLEHFFINRFGRELYLTFFKSYTEKVWGVPCSAISAEWGRQRVKGLSIRAALAQALRKLTTRKPAGGVGQKGVETSLIDQFLYPKLGPGQMWEEVARQVREMGGEIRTGCKVDRILTDGWRVTGVQAGEETFAADYVFSTAPVQELMRELDVAPPANVLEVSDGLVYRDFIAVGLLVSRLRTRDVADNWIYIQEPDVRLGRLQIFNNWSPFLVANREHVWLGLEYFCNTTDALWNLSDAEMAALAIEELARIGIIDAAAVLDSVVLRMEKSYPAYFGTYDRFSEIREYVDRYENLFLVGRNGMHRYNNQDHSMLTAMLAVDNIARGVTDKSNLWEVNTEMDHHEETE